MNIIIVGGGKVGNSLAEILCAEHNVTVIDVNETRIQTIINGFDVKGIIGNCLQTAVLEEADVDKCKVFIALTGSDEVNILSCLIAKKMKKRITVTWQNISNTIIFRLSRVRSFLFLISYIRGITSKERIT